MATLRKWFSSRIFRRRPALSINPEVFVDVQGLPNDSPSDVPQVLSTLSDSMKSAGVPWCVVGDLLLAHYLVPQVTGDIEICVQSENLEKTETLFDSLSEFCFRFRHPASKGYSAHLEKFARFRVRGMNQCFCVVTEAHYGLSPSAFSSLLDESVCGFPLLPLPQYMQGLANVVTGQREKNWTFAIQIEYLIDGMDLDEDWCHKYLEGAAQGYVRNKSTSTAKKNRMGSHPKYDDNLTTFISNETEQQTALGVIGRTMDNLGKNLIRPGASDLDLPVPEGASSSVNESCPFHIQIMSDLHLEYSFHGPGNSTLAGYEAFDCKPCAPVLALLGDIGLVSQDGLFVFLRRQLLKYEKILYVMGNHEFYDSYYEDAKAQMKSFSDEIQKERVSENSLGEFIFLDQTRVDLNANATILGCTLWSHIPSTASEDVGLRLNDFRRIRQWSVETHNAAHIADANWLDRECAKIRTEEPDRRITILTHHAPTMSGTSAPRHESQPMNIKTAFATDMSCRPCWGPPVKVWAFGHTHFCCDFVRKNVRVLSNQRGYEGIDTQHSSFRDDFVLYI